jgi:putative permease
MFDYINSWYRRYFTDPQAALLVILLLFAGVVLYFLGKMLAPLLAALIIAYMLEGPVQKLQQYRTPRLLAVNVSFLLFLVFLLFLLIGLMPVLMRQISQFFQEMPAMINNGQELLLRLPEQYPNIISEEAVWNFIDTIRGGLSTLGQSVLSISVASIPALLSIIIYVVLVPLMVFFFLKDKDRILQWVSRFLPAERRLVTEVWHEMDAQIGNYIRGKVYEILIVGGAAYVLFQFFGLNFAYLLALLVGLSVLIPYIGAAVVTLPVALVAYFQWGVGPDFTWLLISYLVLQFLDGNVLVPILFSEAVNLHPVAIIVAILVFGGLWGFWGVFFAIPLATLVKALLDIWPTTPETEAVSSEQSTENR